MSPIPVPNSSGDVSDMFCSIDSLPNEILLNIFSHVTKHQLLTTIPRVCSRWNTLHGDPSLFRSLVFTNNEPTTSLAIRLIKTASWLTTLHMSDRDDTNELLAHLGPNNPNLETLFIIDCRGSPYNWDIFSANVRNAVRYCTKMRHLSLNGSSVSCSLIYVEIGVKLTQLRTIDFGDMSLYVVSNVLLNIADNCCQLEELRFSHYSNAHIADEVMEKFCERFKLSLRVLQLEGYSWTHRSLEALSQCQNLEAVLFYDIYRISDDGIMYISDLPSIADITLRKAKEITSQGWVRLLGSPGIVERVRSLSFDECKNVDDEVIKAVGRLKNLVDLKVYHASDVTEQCWMSLFGDPRANQITHLALCYCDEVTNQVVRTIKENLVNIKSLTFSTCNSIVNE